MVREVGQAEHHMTTRWLTIVALACMVLGFLQARSEEYRGPFHASLGIVFASFIEMHRRSLHRIDQLEKALGNQP